MVEVPKRCCRVIARVTHGRRMPDELAEYVARGVDMMDWRPALPNGRNGYLFTSQGRVIIKHARYKNDPGPLDPLCPATLPYLSRAYLRHLFRRVKSCTPRWLHGITCALP